MITSGPLAAQSATAEETLHLSQWTLMVCLFVKIMVKLIIIILLNIIGVVISGNEGTHHISSSVNITCSSDLAVQTIRWLNNGQVLITNSGQQQLLLLIKRVTFNHDNTVYTCEVQVMLATGIEKIQEMTTFRVNSNC